MLQLMLKDVDQSWEIQGSEGSQKAIRYLNRFFCFQELHSSAEAAYTACRGYLDQGIFNVVVMEPNFQFQIWNMIDVQGMRLLNRSETPVSDQAKPKKPVLGLQRNRSV